MQTAIKVLFLAQTDRWHAVVIQTTELDAGLWGVPLAVSVGTECPTEARRIGVDLADLIRDEFNGLAVRPASL